MKLHLHWRSFTSQVNSHLARWDDQWFNGWDEVTYLMNKETK